MPVNTVTYQPSVGQLLAAYRPVVLKVEATATLGGPVPPFVIGDIYIDNVYYKSIIRTAPESFTTLLSTWQFDISDALQEYLQPDIAVITNSNLLAGPHMSGKVFVKFRASDVDANGFTVEETLKPIQGTRLTPPVSGTGLQSNSFFVINSALQHEDNQNLAIHLNTFKQGSWATNAYPLSHRSRYYICPGDSDHFPVVFTGDCLDADIVLNYRLKGQTSFSQATALDNNTCAGITFTNSVTGNQVSVALDSAVPSGQSVLVQYKKQADSVWVDAGSYTSQNFSFNVNGTDIAGDYDIRVITFCSPCLSAGSATDTFTLSGTIINTEWRGIDPLCIVQVPDTPTYIVLELRNPVNDDTYFPDEVDPYQRSQTTQQQLYAKFFSDAAHLTPLVVNETGLKIYVKKRALINNSVMSVSTSRTLENIIAFTVNPAGNEVLLGSVYTFMQTDSYSPYPSVTGTYNEYSSYTIYPDHSLTSGNTGSKGFANLAEYNIDTNLPTGVTKPNDDSDPDYIAPGSDVMNCPPGPPTIQVSYGYSLEIAKVEMIFNSASLYAQTIGNTQSGGYAYQYNVPRNTNIAITVKARTLDAGNTTGILKVRVAYIDSGGVYQSATFDIPNNVETSLPQIFQNVDSINISNY